MQKWDYLKVSYDLDGKKARPRSIDGQKIKGWKSGPSMIKHIKQLGEDGWEMIGVEKSELRFKRPKPNGASSEPSNGHKLEEEEIAHTI